MKEKKPIEISKKNIPAIKTKISIMVFPRFIYNNMLKLFPSSYNLWFALFGSMPFMFRCLKSALSSLNV